MLLVLKTDYHGRKIDNLDLIAYSKEHIKCFLALTFLLYSTTLERNIKKKKYFLINVDKNKYLWDNGK